MDGLTCGLIKTALAQTPTSARIFIGYSGGVDSHVLLHLTAALVERRGKITAVYVHHGLQAEAGQWAVHCGTIAHGLGVSFALMHVNAHAQTGESPEEAARNARYAALKSLLKADDVLLVAQHREDQLETVLLQLFRGGGLRGLSGMPERMALGPGFLLRPLLNVAKAEIDGYAKTHSLMWVEDPSNRQCDYDRNFLRNDILPLLKPRWPALDKTVTRTARHCAEAETLLAHYAAQLGDTAINPDHTLSISRLLALSPIAQKCLVRHWLYGLGKKMPSQNVLARLQTELLSARPDAAPQIQTPRYCLRRYQDKLYCLPPSHEVLLTGVWQKDQTVFTINPHQQLQCVSAPRGIPQTVWQQAKVDIRARQGGEKIRLPHRQGRHRLKNLFQEACIPPWEREVMPLVYLDGQLAVVGTDWLSADFYGEGVACWGFTVKPLLG